MIFGEAGITMISTKRRDQRRSVAAEPFGVRDQLSAWFDLQYDRRIYELPESDTWIFWIKRYSPPNRSLPHCPNLS